MNILKIACALTVLATTSIPVMAESVDITVKGTIIPPSCMPTLSGGGSVDYGDINFIKLSDTQLTQLDTKSLDLTIQCNAKTKVALKAVNGRASTAAWVTETGEFGGKIPDGLSKDNGAFVVGLGAVNDKKTGGYTITFSNPKGDGKDIDALYNFSDSDYWFQHNNPSFYGSAPLAISWGTHSDNIFKVPDAFTQISGKINIQAYINKKTELDVTQPIALDGLTTLELHYL